MIGQPGSLAIVEGIDITESSFVEINIYQVEYAQTGSKGLIDVSGGSKVLIKSNIIIDGVSQAGTGIRAVDDSSLAAETNVTVEINNCSAAVSAQKCSFISLDTITGSGNVFGMLAYRGGIVSYNNDTLEKMWSNDANSGGLVLTGSNSTALSGATVEL